MNKRDNNISLLLGASGIVFQMIGFSMSKPGGFVPVRVGFILLIAGLCYYARAKGYSRAFGLFGLLSCVGFLVLAILPDKNKSSNDLKL